MVSINVYPILATWQPNSKGECSILLNIDIDGKRAACPSMRRVIHPKHWDDVNKKVKKSAPNADLLNALIVKEKNLLEGKMLKLQMKDSSLNKQKVKAFLKGNDSGSFIQFFKDFLRDCEQVRVVNGKNVKKLSDNNIRKWTTEYNRLHTYCGGKLSFSDITIKWLEQYETHCGLTLDKHTSLPVSMSRLLQVIRKASKRGMFKMADIEGYKLPTYRNPERPYLTLEQTEDIAKLIYEGKLNHDETLLSVTCYFLAECWAGLRFSDWAKFTIEKLIYNDSLKVVSTTKNKQPIYIPLSDSPRLSKLVYYMRDNNITFNSTEQHTNKLLKTISISASIPFKLTTHVGRHTCATLLLELGYSTEAIAEWLGISKKTVDIYAKNTRRKIINEYQKHGGL